MSAPKLPQWAIDAIHTYDPSEHEHNDCPLDEAPDWVRVLVIGMDRCIVQGDLTGDIIIIERLDRRGTVSITLYEERSYTVTTPCDTTVAHQIR